MFSEEQLEQLKKLIKESEVLSTAEREEWIGLLPFMNDKQLASLESLLRSHQIKDSGGVVSVSVVKPKRDSEHEELPEPPLPPREMLAQVKSDTKKVSGPVAGGKRLEDFIKQNFASDISSPSEYLKKQNEQKAAGDLTKTSVGMGVVSESPALAKPPVVKPVVTPSVAPAPISQDKKVSSTKEEEAEPVKVTEASASSIPGDEAPNKTSKQLLVDVSPPAATKSKPVEPVKLPTPVPAKEGSLQQTKSAVSQKEISESKEPVSNEEGVEEEEVEEVPFVAEPIIKLTSLEDVKKLNIATLRGSGVINISQKLAELAGKNGYFSVVFAIEKSPLYHTYLSMGIKALRDQKSFEEVEQEMDKRTRQYMTKPEFEAFSDMLRKIRSL